MARKDGIVSVGLLILLLFVRSPKGFAANIHIGPLDIHPYASVSMGYTDNVFLTETREESDTYYLISPGVQLFLPLNRHSFNLEYTVDTYLYRDQDNADRTIQNATGRLDLNPFRSLNILIQDAFIDGEDRPDFEDGRTSPYIWNSATVDAAYDINSRLAVGAGYQYGTKRYDRTADRIDDYDENGLSGRIYYKVLPKTSLVIVYQYRDRDYEKRGREDNDSHRLEGGITWEIGPKSSGTARAGYMRTDYDELNRTDEAFSYSLNLTHQLKPKTTLSLEGVREIQDTSRANRNLVFSNDYVSTQIAGTLSHRYRKFTGRLKGGYIWDDYLHDDIPAGKKRRDHLFIGELGIDHALRKWLTLGGSYRYTRLNSNFDVEEYEENNFLIYLSVVL